MTSFAFIIGLFPLWNALGAGGESRRLIGTVTITGVFFSTSFAIFLIPALFVVVERLAYRKRGTELKITQPREEQEPAVAVGVLKRSPH